MSIKKSFGWNFPPKREKGCIWDGVSLGIARLRNSPSVLNISDKPLSIICQCRRCFTQIRRRCNLNYCFKKEINIWPEHRQKKWPKKATNDRNWQKMTRKIKIGSKLQKNWQKKILGMCPTKTWQKLTKIDKNWQKLKKKWQKLTKMGKNRK